MTVAPLLDIPEERKQQELRRARERAGSERAFGRHAQSLMLVCVGWLLLGFGLIGLAFHITDPDRALAAFLAGVLIGNGGPAFTLILSQWLQNQS